MPHDGSLESGAAALALLADAQRASSQVLLGGAGIRRVFPDTSTRWRWDSTRYHAIRRWSVPDFIVEVDAGRSWLALNQELAERGQWLPVGVPDGAPDTVGGLVAAGLTGVWSGGYGPVRDRILAMTVATPAFGVVRLGAPVVKNVAGYNLWRLYWATHGTFGIILTATWKLAPLPRAVARIVYADRAMSVDQAWREAARWRQVIQPWASLLMTVSGEGVGLCGVAHTGEAGVERIRRDLGDGVERRQDLGVPDAYGARVAWQARLPVAGLPGLLAELSRSGGHALAELQSGFVWGFDDRGEGAAQPEAMVTATGGTFRRMVWPWRSPTPPAAEADSWARLKAAVDPDRLLPAMGRPGEA